MTVSELDRVRQALLGNEYQALLELREHYEDDARFAQHVATVLTEAIRTRQASDDSIAAVLAPLIDRAISSSIDQDPHKLAESLYPIMGPAIRKSISETLQQMLANFNQLLEQSLSPRSIHWRFDAWRTGRSYSEIVLLNTLEYEIEQVFFIHRETSLLISHVYSELAARKDADMVSSMFSAIQDFIEDSFSVSEGDVLDTLKLGELTVVIQRGPQAFLAAVVRGNVPGALREQLASTLESLHRLKGRELEDYGGDPAVFADVEPDLRAILELRLREGEAAGQRRIPWLALVALAAALGVFGYWQYQLGLERRAIRDFVSAVDATPGVIVLDVTRSDSALRLATLVDPDAGAPTATPPEAISVTIDARPHLSLAPEIIERRVMRILAPPATADWTLAGRTLRVSGTVTADWWQAARQRWPAVTGLDGIEAGELVIRDPAAERRAAEISQLRQSVAAFSYDFPRAATDLTTADPALDQLATDILELVTLNPGIGFDVVGYTDETGTRALNARLATARADSLRSALVDRGVPAGALQAYSGFDYHAGDSVPALRAGRVFPRSSAPANRGEKTINQGNTTP